MKNCIMQYNCSSLVNGQDLRKTLCICTIYILGFLVLFVFLISVVSHHHLFAIVMLQSLIGCRHFWLHFPLSPPSFSHSRFLHRYLSIAEADLLELDYLVFGSHWQRWCWWVWQNKPAGFSAHYSMVVYLHIYYLLLNLFIYY